MATKQNNAYASALAAFLSYRDGVVYGKKTTFDNDKLATITPEEIVRYFNYKAYGTESPSPVDKPLHARANYLMDIKKKISYFMPLKEMSWHPITRQGNPTKSSKVNKVIKTIKKAEMRHEGKPSQATWPFSLNEFLSILDVVASV